jgi:hypothetical protein
VLTQPQHIRAANLFTGTPAYAWDEWNLKDYYRFEDPAQLDALAQLTNKANTALGIGIGEWICARFLPLDPDPAPLQYMEAAWATMAHQAYCRYIETVDDEWRGPVRAPLAIAIVVVNDAIFNVYEDPHVAWRVCWLYNLAHHVLADSTAFDRWFERSVQRLNQFHSKQAEQAIGAATASLFDPVPFQGRPVPREALDPDFLYHPHQAPALLDTYLRSLKPASNPFLSSVNELNDVEHLPSAPYTY